jgi:hypothetical protein
MALLAFRMRDVVATFYTHAGERLSVTRNPNTEVMTLLTGVAPPLLRESQLPWQDLRPP